MTGGGKGIWYTVAAHSYIGLTPTKPHPLGGERVQVVKLYNELLEGR